MSFCCYCAYIYIFTQGMPKNLPDHGGNQTRDNWFTRPTFYQLSYVKKSARVGDRYFETQSSSPFDISMFYMCL